MCLSVRMEILRTQWGAGRCRCITISSLFGVAVCTKGRAVLGGGLVHSHRRYHYAVIDTQGSSLP